MSRHLHAVRQGNPLLAAGILSHPVEPRELAAVAMLACLPSEAHRALAEQARLRSYRSNEVVFEEGDHGDSLHVVRRGVVHVIRPSHDADHVLQTLRAGDVFGELAVLNSGARMATIVAATNCETIELAKGDVDRMLEQHPDGARRMLGTLAMSLTMAKEDVARQNQALEERVRERTQELESAQLEIVRRLGQATESHDEDTGVHVTRMSKLAHGLGVASGLDDVTATMLLHAAPMHDIGKIGIPDDILRKPAKLDPEEWEIMKTHTTIGAQILSGSRSPMVRMAETIALSHHERWDGTGYPEGRRGEEIPLAARICAICDVFDALISKRRYKPAWPIDTALVEIAHQGGRHFDPKLTELFLKLPLDLFSGRES